MTSAINWFELPTRDLERARRFYEAVLGETLEVFLGGRRPMAFFPKVDGVNGALIQDAHEEPGATGATVYLNTNGRLGACVRRVEAAGGRIVVPITDIGPNGRYVVVIDTEGNRVGLHEEARGAA